MSTTWLAHNFEMATTVVTNLWEQEQLLIHLQSHGAKYIIIDTEGTNAQVLSMGVKTQNGLETYLLHNLPITHNLYRVMTSGSIIKVCSHNA